MAVLNYASPPALGFCGHSGSGKTTLIEKLLPALNAAGLKTGYLKHDAHKLDVDREGKDTDRIFRAGAEIIKADSSAETFIRSKSPSNSPVNDPPFWECDIVLVEGYKDASWDKLWVCPHAGGEDKMPDLKNVVGKVGANGFPHGSIDKIFEFIKEWLKKKTEVKPVYGGLLIGGKSRRMGSPKQFREIDGVTMSEAVFKVLKEVCPKTFMLGNAPLPECLGNEPRIADAPGINGPIAGLVSAHRFDPTADWLIMALDIPYITADYLSALLERRNPGFRFVAAHNPATGNPETVCSLYSSQALFRIENERQDELSIFRLLKKLGYEGNPELYDANLLKNINRPEDAE